MNYYNEFDPKAAAWLRELIKQKLIPDGVVDTRSITEIKPDEIKNYTQCHFFAGIGGWSLALKIAGWPESRPVWTGSCPCQPFSSAGKQLGTADERHLWPVFFNLIRECRPVCVFGEQVANAIGKGWLDGISADLEADGYACGATVLGAHSVGAPGNRKRLYWVADPVGEHTRFGRIAGAKESTGGSHGHDLDGCGGGLGHTLGARLEGHIRHGNDGHEPGRLGASEAGPVAKAGCDSWSDFVLILCADGKARRIKPGLAPLAHGVPARVVRLRGYGNAIVPQVAAAFIEAAG